MSKWLLYHNFETAASNIGSSVPGRRMPDATDSKTSRRPTAGDNW